jgi:membrane protein DedA with SNARE-associated domain
MSRLPFPFFLPLPAVGVLISLAVTIFWLWMLTDCASNESSEGNDKLIWILIILFVPLFGSVIYYLVRRPQRIKVVRH